MKNLHYILDTQDGETFAIDEILSYGYLELLEFRRKLKDSNKRIKPRYVCLSCRQKLNLKCKPSQSKKFYFAHYPNSEDCTWKQGEELSYEKKRLAMYANVRESDEHKYLKSFIEKYLKSDKTFSNVNVEKRYYDKEREIYKVPDISAELYDSQYSKKIKLIFEIQLSTTFLDVIADREKFYYEQGDNIIWIFSKYPKDLSKTKMTYDDILSSNKKNIFILDDEAQKMSIEHNSLYLKNIYIIPIIANGVIQYKWSSVNFVNIKNISHDEITGKSFIYNFEYERTKLLYREKIKKNKGYSEIINILEENINKNNSEIKDILKEKNIFLQNEKMLLNFQNTRKSVCYILEIMNMNTSDKHYDNAFLGYENKDIQLLNMLFNYTMMKNYNFFHLLLKAIDYYGKSEYILSLDKKGTLANKIKNIKMKIDDEVLNENNILVFKYMFPELFYTSSIPKTNF